MIVVSDTSPIVAFHHLNELEILHALFQEVLVPPAVAAELRKGTIKWPPIDLSAFPFIEIRAPRHPERAGVDQPGIHPGELEAIALALECGPCLLLIDEKRGREAARELGVQYTGTLGVLLRAKATGLLPEIRPLIDRLVEGVDFFVSNELRAAILRRAGERE